MKKIITLFLLLAAITNVNAQWKKIKGNKNVITATRNVAHFQEIKSSGSFHVILTDDKTGTLEITAEENLMEYIETSVSKDILKINFKKGHNIQARKKITIKVPIESIKSLSLSGSGEITSKVAIKNDQLTLNTSGSGDIYLKKIKSKEVFARMSGSGNITIAGKTKKLDVKISGSADFQGKNLDSENTSIKISGSGNATVVAQNSLKGKVTGSGDIYYKGEPQNVNVKANGSGEVHKL